MWFSYMYVYFAIILLRHGECVQEVPCVGAGEGKK